LHHLTICVPAIAAAGLFSKAKEGVQCVHVRKVRPPPLGVVHPKRVCIHIDDLRAMKQNAVKTLPTEVHLHQKDSLQ
jgi:hypothetical protein